MKLTRQFLTKAGKPPSNHERSRMVRRHPVSDGKLVAAYDRGIGRIDLVDLYPGIKGTGPDCRLDAGVGQGG